MSGLKKKDKSSFKIECFLDKIFLKAVYILSEKCRNIIPC